MMEAIFVLVGIIIGFAGFVIGRRIVDGNNKRRARSEADRLVSKAKFEAQKIEQSAKQKARDLENQIKKSAEQEIRKQREQISNQERSLKDKERSLDKKSSTLEKDLKDKVVHVESRAKEMDHM